MKKILDRIFVDGLSGMAQGLFATLIIGTIIQQIGTFAGGDIGELIYLVGKVAAGLTGDPSVTPARVAAYSDKHGYVDENNNTYWRLMSEGCRDFGLSCYEGEIRESAVVSELKAGHPVICSVGPGDFTDKGHFIVLAGCEDGKIKVNDPNNRENSEKLWEFDRIQSQIRDLWVFRNL